jgi:hypothetical protein
MGKKDFLRSGWGEYIPLSPAPSKINGKSVIKFLYFLKMGSKLLKLEVSFLLLALRHVLCMTDIMSEMIHFKSSKTKCRITIWPRRPYEVRAQLFSVKPAVYCCVYLNSRE